GCSGSGSCTGGIKNPDCTCSYPGTALINEVDGWMGEVEYTLSTDTFHVNGNDLIQGVLGFVTNPTTYDCYNGGGSGLCSGFVSMNTFGGNTFKDIFVYMDSNVVDRQSGKNPRGFVL